MDNTLKIIIKNEPDAIVGRYIKRSDLNKVFEGRIAKIQEYVRLAQNAETKLKLDDALRNYYWAYSLLETLPSMSTLTTKDHNGETRVLSVWIPSKINEILDEINVKVLNQKDGNIDLLFTHKDSPITSIDYRYFDGHDYSAIYSAKDGRGTIELPQGIEFSQLQIKYEYTYKGQSHIDREVENVLGVVREKYFKKASKNINLQEDKATVADTKILTLQTKNSTTSISNHNKPSFITDKKAVIKKVTDAIQRKQYENVKQLFTIDGYDMFQKLIHYGNARILDLNEITYTQLGENTIVRSIPMSFTFAKGARHSFVENIVLTLNKDNLIDGIAFGLDDSATKDIMGKTVWSIEARQIIITFLENYKTAFALKRLDYIKDIFADNAVIIVGKTTTRLEPTGNEISPYHKNKYVERTLLTKQQYIANLERCFAKNEFVNIRFENNDVTKAGVGGELYGIQIKQDYYSSTYGDTGYLYLQVDLNTPDTPIIRVRTWQEAPDPELMKFGGNGIYGIENF